MKRSLILLLCLLTSCIWALPVFATGETEEAGGAPALLLEYWTEGSGAAQDLNAYLQAVTDESSPDFIPVEDRIAVFDLDGTLMCETDPFCFEYMVFSDYVLNHADELPEDVVAVAREIEDAAGKEKPSGMSTRQATAGAIAYQGMTMSELSEMVRNFKESQAWGFSGMTRGEAFYKPMVELFNALLENDFTVYIVTATERNIVREVINGVLDIPPAHVIGTEYGYTATNQGEEADGDYTFQPSDQIVFDGTYEGENAKTCKVDAIVREIGQQPVLAFGNSSGDLAMEVYTITNNPYKSAAYMVVADDEEREFGDAESAEEKKEAYTKQGIGIISMRDDFKTIYGEGVQKTGPADAAKSAARQKTTEDFMAILEENPELKTLMEKSIAQAAAINPDRETNPVQSLEEYYDFLDWSATCMPWNILNNQKASGLYTQIDQSLDYFYYLLDQPLPELAGKGYYYPCLEYVDPINAWCKAYAASWGEFLSTEESWNDDYYALACEDDSFGMKTGWYADTNIWTSFNDWFSRKLVSADQRPIADADIICPADSTPQGIWHIDENSQLDLGVQLKSEKFYNVNQIIGEDSAYKDCFANGTLTHTFLDVNDYHRYHFPVGGTILEVRKIEGLDAVGGIVGWDPDEGKYVLYDANPGWQSIETRDCVILDTEFGLVAILPIAMSQVSSCNWEDTVQVGAKVEKGDPMGYFLFGGSDIVMIFQEEIELQLTPGEHYLMGEPYAKVAESAFATEEPADAA